MDDLLRTLRISTAGMKAQGTRLRVISENVANADSLPTSPGGLPYRRKVVTFRNELDRTIGVEKVMVDRIGVDKSSFPRKYDPSHPAADAQGYVLTPNVNALMEMMDMREAQRSYESNMSVIKSSKTMLQDTISLMR
ncbi:MAG: flagellar basal body rod protein FlgC [Rhodospirillaceae bacterium]|nr:flagellar basal body rod protein FlgC [Rhodospirillaceae bacterium]